MADFQAKATPTIDPLETGSDERGADTAEAPTPATPGRLDSPIERADLSAPDTFIPESVDQLLAH
jgi:hypothetical protein